MSTVGDPAQFSTRAPKLGLVSGFDGIRGIGVCMVLVGHALSRYVESWVTVVDAFFVLSGFLITTLLLQEARSTGTIGLKKFYLRRAVRLLPSVWLFVGVWLVISSIATIVGFEPLNLRHVGADAAAALFYVYHLVFPNGLYVIEPDIQANRTMWHLWTLSVEEWFYAVIAGTVLVCVRRRWVAQLGWIMAASFVAVGAARWFAYTGFWQDSEGVIPGVRMAFLQRPDALMLGVALACANAYFDEERRDAWRQPVLAAATAGLVLWVAMLNLSSGAVRRLGGPYLDYLPHTPEEFNRTQMMGELYWFRFGHTLGALGFGVVVFALARYQDWWVSRLWSWQPFQWMGRLSYTLYVWHAMPYLFLMALLGGADPSPTVELLRTPILVASAFLVSWPVYKYVELRVLRMKLQFSSEKEALDLTTGKMVQVDQLNRNDRADADAEADAVAASDPTNVDVDVPPSDEGSAPR